MVTHNLANQVPACTVFARTHFSSHDTHAREHRDPRGVTRLSRLTRRKHCEPHAVVISSDVQLNTSQCESLLPLSFNQGDTEYGVIFL